jgi:hypothetical protein
MLDANVAQAVDYAFSTRREALFDFGTPVSRAA